LLTFALPLVSVLFHNGAITARDVTQTTAALMGYGAGLLGLVAIKVLAPGYFASQDIKTPALIGVAVLLATQGLNLIFVPYLAHAGLALAIGVGALINALWLLLGLLRRRTFVPEPGWGRFLLQVLAASTLMALFLMWAGHHFDWIELRAERLKRIGLMAFILIGSAAIYFISILASGLKLRQLLRH
jgi:putative peptidoglycan lipid II flippase